MVPIKVIFLFYLFFFITFYFITKYRIFWIHKNLEIIRWRRDNLINIHGGAVIAGVLYAILCNNVLSYVILTSLWCISYYDDVKYVSPNTRLAVHFICAFYFVLYAGISSTLYGWFYIFFIVSMINGFNFIDNMNALCSGVSVVIAISLGLILVDSGLLFLGLIPLPIFIFFNLKYGLRLGDNGAVCLGFVLSSVAIHLPFVVVFLVFFIPIIDFVFVIIRRLVEGRIPWEGSTDHLSHILARKIGETWAVLSLITINLLTAFIAYSVSYPRLKLLGL